MCISPAGLEFGNRLNRNHWDWSDFDGFNPESWIGLEMVGCTFSSTYDGGQDRGLVGWGLEMPLNELLPLLEQARRRWGGAAN